MSVMRGVYATGDPILASIAKQALTDAGLEFVADEAVASGLLIGQPTSFPHVTFRVQDGDFDKAEAAIHAALYRTRETPEPGDSHNKRA